MDVIYYYPWGYFYPVCSGAAFVAERHLEYFRSRGIRPHLLVLGSGESESQRAFERHYDWVEDISVFCLPDHPSIQRLFDVWEFGNFLKGHAALCEIPRFRSLLARPVDLGFFNYVFSAPLLDHASNMGARILESHDILSKQFLMYQRSPVLMEHHVRVEFDMYELYDTVIMINEEEAELAKARTAANVVYVPRPVPRIAEETRLEESGAGAYDLLFVGSHHRPNVEGATWFYHHVFRPHLKPRDLSWAIVGSVCDGLDFEDSSVHPLGLVEDLSAVYRRSKTVVIPLFDGAGISIKTLEAMGHGKPIVTTPCGARGLKDCDRHLIKLAFDRDAHAVADRILELCGSAPLREAYGRKAMLYVKERFSPEAYEQHMDALLASVTQKSPTTKSGGGARAA